MPNYKHSLQLAQEQTFKQPLQQSLSFGIQDHYSQVHSNQENTVIAWQATTKKGTWTKINKKSDIPAILKSFIGGNDTYFSVNEFHGWRKVSLLAGLNAFYVDIDNMDDVQVALTACDDALIPRPSMLIKSGRGIHLYWFLEKAERHMLGLWQRVQSHLIDNLKDIGADPAARDCTRILRLTDTINSKSGTKVEGFIIDAYRWTINEFATETIGEFKPAAIPKHRRKAKKRTTAIIRDISAKQSAPNKRVTGSIYNRWHRVYEDLILLAKYHNGIPDGFRNNWLFLTANALSWFTHADAVKEEIKWIMERYTTLTADDINAMKSVLDRADAAAKGETVEWNGVKADPRYRFRRQTLYDWCEDYIPDSLLPELKGIIPDSVAEQRKKERNQGRYKREKQALKEDGMALLIKGHKTAVVAVKIGVSLRTVQAWNKLLKSGTYTKSAKTEPCIALPPRGADDKQAPFRGESQAFG